MPRIVYELPRPKVVMDVIRRNIIPPIKRCETSVKIRKRVLGQNTSSCKKQRNHANTKEFVEGQQNRALVNIKEKQTFKTYQRPSANSLVCFEHKNAKKPKNPDPQLEEEKQVTSGFCRDEIL